MCRAPTPGASCLRSSAWWLRDASTHWRSPLPWSRGVRHRRHGWNPRRSLCSFVELVLSPRPLCSRAPGPTGVEVGLPGRSRRTSVTELSDRQRETLANLLLPMLIAYANGRDNKSGYRRGVLLPDRPEPRRSIRNQIAVTTTLLSCRLARRVVAHLAA